MNKEKSVQEIFAPNNGCFGCGCANEKGLQIKSFQRGDELIATFNAEKHHEAFEGMLNGGIIGSLLDCHCNWAAALHLKTGDELPCTVTAEYTITMKLPTPSTEPIHLTAKVVEASERKAVVEGTLGTKDKVTALCRGTFVAVKPGHPAYNRW